MKKVVIAQARMGSTRLPGKVMLDLAGEPMLARFINRLKRSTCADQVVIATTTKDRDDIIAEFCGERRIACFRGDEDDLLDRYYQAALAHEAEVIVRVTSDCPLIDPTMVDALLTSFSDHQERIDYLCNFLPSHTLPRGLEVEVFSMAALTRAWQEDDKPEWREHVTEYILHHPELFRLQGYSWPTDLSSYRWTVDQAEDLELVRKIYTYFGRDDFGWQEVLPLLAQHPEWCDINRHVQQKVVM